MTGSSPILRHGSCYIPPHCHGKASCRGSSAVLGRSWMAMYKLMSIWAVCTGSRGRGGVRPSAGDRLTRGTGWTGVGVGCDRAHLKCSARLRPRGRSRPLCHPPDAACNCNATCRLADTINSERHAGMPAPPDRDASVTVYWTMVSTRCTERATAHISKQQAANPRERHHRPVIVTTCTHPARRNT